MKLLKNILLYAIVTTFFLCLVIIQAEITSLKQVFEVLLELDSLAESNELKQQAEIVTLTLDELKRYLENDISLSSQELLELTQKINYFEENIDLPTRSRRSDYPEIHPTTIVDPNYYRPRDAYLRNLIITGSLIVDGQQVPAPDNDPYLPLAGGTMTGNIIMSNQTSIVFDDASNTGSITISAPASVVPSYTLALPTAPGAPGTVLTADGNNPSQLSWQPVTAISTSTIQLYGDVIGSASANKVAFVCGVPACALAQTYSTVLSATSGNVCGTLVLRDSNCNFFANNITANLTGTATFALASLTTVSAQFSNSTNFAFTSSVAQFATSALTSVSSTYFHPETCMVTLLAHNSNRRRICLWCASMCISTNILNSIVSNKR